MKKLYLSAFALFMISFFAMAQQRDPAAKAILDAVSSKFKTYNSVAANFAYQIQNSAGKVLSKKTGTVIMKGDKYNIALGGNKIISDGNTVWNYDPTSKEVTVNNANKSSNTITPQKLFTKFYDNDFMYILAGDGNVGGRKTTTVLLQPIDSKKPFSRVYLAIDKVAKTILSATVVEKGGNRYIYSINNLKPNTAMSDAQFTFNKAAYPGVEVVDLR